MKETIAWFTALRKALGILTGRACRWYNILGIMFIFIILQRPNQENMPFCQVCRSLLMSVSRGGKLRGKTSSNLLGKLIPRYLMLELVNLKGKSALSRFANEVGRETFNAFDFW